MNDELKAIAIEAGAPDELLDKLWFSMFCMKFTDLLIAELEQSE
jgi:hypothetical protein